MCLSGDGAGGDSKQKVVLIRGTLFASLIAAAGICAGVAYSQIKKSEDTVAVEAFNSIAKGAAFAAQQIAVQKLYGVNTMATIMSQSFPGADSWPMKIELPGYVPISSSIAQLSGSLSQAVSVIVAPDQVLEFQEHAKSVYENDGRPESAGVSDFGFGVWKPDKVNDPKLYEDGRINATNGENYWGGEDPNLAVLLLHNINDGKALLYNLYSVENRGPYIDSMRACSKLRPNEEAVECHVVTDMLQLISRPGEPAALMFHPIYPANDPGNFVGFAIGTFDWASVLTSTIPSYVDGLICVIRTDAKASTYEIRDGVPNFLGESDLHDPKYDQYKHGPTKLLEPSSATSSANYTLTIYPSEVMFSEFQSSTPVVVAVSLVAVICFVTGIFLLYDILVRREARELRAQAGRNKMNFARAIAKGSTANLFAVDPADGKKKMTPEALGDLFKHLDKDGNGSVERDELKEFVGDMVVGKDFEAMWADIDLNNDNSLHFAEFCHFMAEVGAMDEESG